MVKFGYKLCSEEHGANDLVRYARMAEEAGFEFGAISDHFHPWTDSQGESPFVWGVLGALSRATERMSFGTTVTCPTIRTHPAIVAHAAATAAELLPGRFFLGVGTGENLNEHILGDRWPSASVRREMLEEAIEVIRGLWTGELFNHEGKHYTVENARLYSLPDELPPIHVAAAGEKAVELAGRAGDGLISLAPDSEMIEKFEEAGGRGKPTMSEATVCWGEDEEKAVRTALECWPIVGIGGELTQELPLPRHFEQAAESVSEDDIAEKVPCGPDPERHIENARKYLDAGYDHVWFHQIGPDQEGFLRFYQEQVLPELR